MLKQNEQLRKAQKLLKISNQKINENEQEYLYAISDTPTYWNSLYIEEDNIVNLDEESDSQPQNTNNLVEKIKRNLHKPLNHYWDAPLDHSLLLDPYFCKYNSLCIENENITDLPNNEPNKKQMQLFSIMFGSDITQVKNEIDEYLTINQVTATTNPLNWWKNIQ
ncbi:36323_t:CDS:2, partial [Gigaspora margarita]